MRSPLNPNSLLWLMIRFVAPILLVRILSRNGLLGVGPQSRRLWLLALDVKQTHRHQRTHEYSVLGEEDETAQAEHEHGSVTTKLTDHQVLVTEAQSCRCVPRPSAARRLHGSALCSTACLAVGVRTLLCRSRGGPGALLWHHGRLAGSGRQADRQARSTHGADAVDFRRGSGDIW